MVLNWKSFQGYPLKLEFVKAPFLVLHFSHNTFLTLLMLSVILLSLLMILPFTLSVPRHLIMLQPLKLVCELKSGL